MSAAADKLTKVDSATEDKIAADKKAVHRRTSSAVSGVYKIEDLGKRSSFRLLRTIRNTSNPVARRDPYGTVRANRRAEKENVELQISAETQKLNW